MSRRCLICSNINPCRDHSAGAQDAELRRNQAEIRSLDRGPPPHPIARAGLDVGREGKRAAEEACLQRFESDPSFRAWRRGELPEGEMLTKQPMHECANDSCIPRPDAEARAWTEAERDGAELLWANLPTQRPWTALKPEERALVIHTYQRLFAKALAPAERAAIVEECARLVEEWNGSTRDGDTFHIAAAIRQLKGEGNE